MNIRQAKSSVIVESPTNGKRISVQQQQQQQQSAPKETPIPKS